MTNDKHTLKRKMLSDGSGGYSNYPAKKKIKKTNTNKEFNIDDLTLSLTKGILEELLTSDPNLSSIIPKPTNKNIIYKRKSPTKRKSPKLIRQTGEKTFIPLQAKKNTNKKEVYPNRKPSTFLVLDVPGVKPPKAKKKKLIIRKKIPSKRNVISEKNKTSPASIDIQCLVKNLLSSPGKSDKKSPLFGIINSMISESPLISMLTEGQNVRIHEKNDLAGLIGKLALKNANIREISPDNTPTIDEGNKQNGKIKVNKATQ